MIWPWRPSGGRAEAQSDLGQVGLILKELYGADNMTKNAHRDALAEAAEANPNDADLLFLLGVHLHFDGQADRARKIL